MVLLASCTKHDASLPLGYSESEGESIAVELSTSSYSLEPQHDFTFTGTDEGQLLASPAYFQGTPSGGTVVFDAASSTLKGYNSDGILVWFVGENGTGPGQFNSPTGLAVSPLGEIYVANNFGTRLDAFSEEGKYLKSWNLADTGVTSAQMAGFAGSNSIVLYKHIPSKYGASIFVVDIAAEPTVVASFEYVNEPVGFVPEEGFTLSPQVSVYGDVISVSSIDSFQFKWFDLSGNEIDHYYDPNIEVLGPLFQNRGGRQRGFSLSILNAPIRLSENRWLLGGAWPNNIPSAEEFFNSLSSGNPLSIEYDKRYLVYDLQDKTVSQVAEESMSTIDRIFGGDGEGSIFVARMEFSVFGKYGISVN